MNEARTARENALTFEAKKDGLSQRQDGSLVVRFKLHPNDEVDALVKAPMGARFTMVLVELNDDDTPKAQARTETQEPAARTDKSPRKSPAQMAGWLCSEPKFWAFLNEESILYPSIGRVDCEVRAAETVRLHCGVSSRKEITSDNLAWDRLYSDFRAWEALPRTGG